MATDGKGIAALRAWARALKREIAALWFALRDPACPVAARVLGIIIIGYALSPIDLIPDFIPVLGYLDDLLILPLLLALLRRIMPEEVMERGRARAAGLDGKRLPSSRLAAIVIVLVWVALLAFTVAVVIGMLRRSSGG